MALLCVGDFELQSLETEGAFEEDEGLVLPVSFCYFFNIVHYII